MPLLQLCDALLHAPDNAWAKQWFARLAEKKATTRLLDVIHPYDRFYVGDVRYGMVAWLHVVRHSQGHVSVTSAGRGDSIRRRFEWVPQQVQENDRETVRRR